MRQKTALFSVKIVSSILLNKEDSMMSFISVYPLNFLEYYFFFFNADCKSSRILLQIQTFQGEI